MKEKIIIPFLLAIIFLLSCNQRDNINTHKQESSLKSIVILYTNDEHGWMEPTDNYGGAANMFELWKTREEYNSADSFLILSGGDMWTGPAISTWFQGESMIEVMNKMEYDAAAIGNHEFDFTIDILNQNLGMMNFPLIAANITEKSTGQIPSFAQPYIIENVNGVKVGIIGLSSIGTPYTTFPTHVEDYEFTSYEEAIIKYAPIAKNNGAEILIVVGHIYEEEMDALASVAYANGISLITGGHSHRYVSKTNQGVTLIESGSDLKSYMKVVIEYDKISQTTTIKSHETINNPYSSNITNDVQTIVEYWQTRVDEDLSEVIGYCSEQINENSTAMKNMVTDSWLFAYPNADISITNAGGIRQNIFFGDITLETIVGVLPFANTLYELELSGAQVIDCLDNFIIGGITTLGGYFLSDGSPLEDNKVYTVITTDYLYSQPDSKFALYDANPINTSISYMQPTVDWIKSKNTSVQNPLNNYLDNTPRR